MSELPQYSNIESLQNEPKLEDHAKFPFSRNFFDRLKTTKDLLENPALNPQRKAEMTAMLGKVTESVLMLTALMEQLDAAQQSAELSLVSDSELDQKLYADIMSNGPKTDFDTNLAYQYVEKNSANNMSDRETQASSIPIGHIEAALLDGAKISKGQWGRQVMPEVLKLYERSSVRPDRKKEVLSFIERVKDIQDRRTEIHAQGFKPDMTTEQRDTLIKKMNTEAPFPWQKPENKLAS